MKKDDELTPEEEALRDIFIPLHTRATKSASDLQVLSKATWDRRTKNQVARDALFQMHTGLVRLHDCISEISLKKWAPVAPILFRTVIEGIVGAIAIVNGSAPNLAAFKFFCSYLRLPLIATMQGKAKEERRRVVEEMLGRLPQADRKEARDFVNAQSEPRFWYKPEFSGPTEILEEFWPDGLVLYKHYSASTHFGFFAPFFYMEDWSRLDPWQRREPIAICRVLLESSVLLARFGQIRGGFEGLDCSSTNQVIAQAKLARDSYLS